MGYPLIPPKYSFQDSSGAPLAGGFLYVYNAGTSTEATTYADADLTTANDNPIVLDARGEAPSGIFLKDGIEYKFVLTDSSGSVIWTQDKVKSPGQDIYTNVADWGALGAGTSNEAGFIQNAIDSVYAAGGGTVFIPPGTYLLNDALVMKPGVNLIGTGAGTILKGNSASLSHIIKAVETSPTTYRSVISDFFLDGQALVGVEVNNALLITIRNIATTSNGTADIATVFYFLNTYGSKFENLSTAGAQEFPTYCFRIGNAFNANHCSNFYTSNLNCGYNYYIKSNGHGNSFDTLTAQGGEYGFWIEGTFRGAVFNGTYIENVAHPIVLGVKGTSSSVYGLAFSGGEFASCAASHSNYADRIAVVQLNYCWNITFDNCDFGAVSGTPVNMWAARYDRCYNIEFNNCYSAAAGFTGSLKDYIVTQTGYHSGSNVAVNNTNGGSEQSQQFVMKSNDYSNHYFAIEIDRGGTADKDVSVKQGNKHGQATLVSGSAAVNFSTSEDDDDYSIMLTGNANETFYWSSKTSWGFVINSSNGSSTASVDWTIVREGPQFLFTKWTPINTDTFPNYIAVGMGTAAITGYAPTVTVT